MIKRKMTLHCDIYFRSPSLRHELIVAFPPFTVRPPCHCKVISELNMVMEHYVPQFYLRSAKMSVVPYKIRNQ
jgi:hypothetical protein